MDSDSFINYSEYETSRLTSGKIEQKAIPAVHQFYQQIPVFYNYGTEKNMVLDDFIIEGCEMEGLEIQTQVINNKTEHIMKFRLDVTNFEHLKFIETINKIYQDNEKFIERQKNNVKKEYFITPLIKHSRDPLTGKPIQHRYVSMFLKLVHRGLTQTIFTDREGKFLSWHTLKNTTLIPKIHIKNIYVGHVISFRIELLSAVVTSITPNITPQQKCLVSISLPQSKEVRCSITTPMITTPMTLILVQTR